MTSGFALYGVYNAIKQSIDCAAIKEAMPPPPQSQLGWRRQINLAQKKAENLSTLDF
jgi:hypothetical protein